jgi:acyl-coenzyme A synthetase/AMP-(fatty) acid ligase
MGFIFNWMCLKKTTFKDENLDLSSVKFVMPMGSTVPESLCEDLQKFMNGMQFVYHIYGMTEIGSTIAVTIDVRNLGVVHANAAVKIVDPNTGKLCGPHETGEILALGTCYMKGRVRSTLAFQVTHSKMLFLSLSKKGL